MTPKMALAVQFSGCVISMILSQSGTVGRILTGFGRGPLFHLLKIMPHLQGCQNEALRSNAAWGVYRTANGHLLCVNLNDLGGQVLLWVVIHAAHVLLLPSARLKSLDLLHDEISQVGASLLLLLAITRFPIPAVLQ